MKNTLNKAKREDFLVYLSLIALPILQFIIFYIIVNANSLALSFKDYSYVVDETGKTILKTSFVGFDNIIDVYNKLFNDEMFSKIIGNSFLFYWR